MVISPGLAFTALALAIFIWPELLAYLVATALLFVGLTLVAWGWKLRSAERRARRQQNEGTVYYRVM